VADTWVVRCVDGSDYEVTGPPDLPSVFGVENSQVGPDDFRWVQAHEVVKSPPGLGPLTSLSTAAIVSWRLK
jgi:hypothetical protein